MLSCHIGGHEESEHSVNINNNRGIQSLNMNIIVRFIHWGVEIKSKLLLGTHLERIASGGQEPGTVHLGAYGRGRQQTGDVAYSPHMLGALAGPNVDVVEGETPRRGRGVPLHPLEDHSGLFGDAESHVMQLP